MQIQKLPVCLAALALTLNGCTVPQVTPDALTPAPVTQEITPDTTTTSTPAPAVSPTVPVPPIDGSGSDELVLRVWLSDVFAPSSNQPGAEVLLDQLVAFDEARPDIKVEYLPKRVHGPGGMLAYLKNASGVAPSILPDLALLDREALLEANTEKLIDPIDGKTNPAILAGLYPAAIKLGQVNDVQVGLPYVMEFDHAVYRYASFQSEPITFVLALENRKPADLPAGSVSTVSRIVLSQYMAGGGFLADDAGKPALNADVLARVLTFYRNARDLGVFDPSLLQLEDPASTWALYRAGQSNFAAVTSTQYLAERGLVRGTFPCNLPTVDGKPFALVRGWSWALVTHDAERQENAIALVNFLMNPVNQGAYTQSAGWLPTQPTSLTVWGNDDTYPAFAGPIMEAALPQPDADQQATAGGAIQDALEAVILNDYPPAQAAADAASKVSAAAGNTP